MVRLISEQTNEFGLDLDRRSGSNDLATRFDTSAWSFANLPLNRLALANVSELSLISKRWQSLILREREREREIERERQRERERESERE